MPDLSLVEPGRSGGRRWLNSAFRNVVPDDVGTEFRSEDAYAHPGDLAAIDGRRRKSVCIVGGGIAGLIAAYELTRLGHAVTLLEKSDRFGGRIWTKRFADGTYGELGAMRIPENHACVLHYIDNVFELPKRTFVPFNPQAWCLFRDSPKQRRWEWDRNWSQHYPRSRYHRRRKPPSSLSLLADLAKSVPLTPEDWWEALSNELTTSRLQQVDSMSLSQHVLGIPNFAATDPNGRAWSRLDDETWEFLGRTSNHMWLEGTSLLHWLREARILERDDGDKYELEGGTERLTDACVAAIEAQQEDVLRLNCTVRAIHPHDDGVLVHWRDASTGDQWVQFDFAICTVPAPATLAIDFGGYLRPSKREALSSLSYISAGKTIMRCSARHWELYDGIYGGNSVTDRPNQQCWYPSDNAGATDAGDSSHGRAVLIAQPEVDLLESPVVDLGLGGYGPVDALRSHEPGVFLAAYLWGKNAQRFASMSASERDDMIVDSVRQLHERNDQHLEEIVHLAWDAEANPGGGAFAFFAPGEHRRYQAALCAALPEDDPRVFFAGEHLGILQGWIQGSIQTALSATAGVLETP